MELNDLLRRRAEFIMHRVRQSYYFNGSKPSRLQALKLKHNESRASINTIKIANNKFTYDPQEINVAFHSFYKELYQSTPNFDSVKCKQFLSSLDLPTLGEQEATDLVRPISLKKLETALRMTNKGKSPGPDGKPPELLLHFWDILGQCCWGRSNQQLKKDLSLLTLMLPWFR